MEGLDLGLLVAVFLLGLRHGIDWDHIAAISDIAGSQSEPRSSVVLATLYAVGHGLMVLVLGGIAILVGDLLPSSVDATMERVVGVTLIVLAAYVFYSLARYRRGFRMRSRWMLLIDAARRGLARVRGRHPHVVEIEHEHEHAHDGEHAHEGEHAHLQDDGTAVAVERLTVAQRTHRHPHRHIVEMPADPFTRYGRVSSFAIGLLHGVGAETPSQITLFVTAAGVGGALPGFFLLAVFLLGLLVSNAAVAVAATFGFLQATRSFSVYVAIAVVTGVVSLVLGLAYVAGRDDLIPALIGG